MSQLPLVRLPNYPRQRWFTEPANCLVMLRPRHICWQCPDCRSKVLSIISKAPDQVFSLLFSDGCAACLQISVARKSGFCSRREALTFRRRAQLDSCLSDRPQRWSPQPSRIRATAPQFSLRLPTTRITAAMKMNNHCSARRSR